LIALLITEGIDYSSIILKLMCTHQWFILGRYNKLSTSRQHAGNAARVEQRYDKQALVLLAVAFLSISRLAC
jgi:CRISPR/Cas system-associated protein Csx1